MADDSDVVGSVVARSTPPGGGGDLTRPRAGGRHDPLEQQNRLSPHPGGPARG